MKKIFSIVLVLALVLEARAITPFFIKLANATNAASAQQIGVALITPATAPDTAFTVYGTNLIFGGNSTTNFTIVLDGTGYSSNAYFPGTYKFVITNLNAAFLAVIPDTTNFNSLTLYITNIQVFPGIAFNSYGTITNMLGFPPATNTTAAALALLGFQPATNSFTGIITPLGYTPATNTYNGVTNSLGMAPATNNNSGIVFALGFTPATNTYNGMTNSLGFAPATNSNSGITSALGFTPATNTYNGVTNSLGMAPATNNNSGINFALGYTAGTNNGYIGQGALAGIANLSTNGFQVWVAYKTNNVPGPAFTNLPVGSLMTTTNGGFYRLSNLVWQAIAP